MSGAEGRTYDVSADSERFLALKVVGAETAGELAEPQLNIVQNWFEELRRLVPVN